MFVNYNTTDNTSINVKAHMADILPIVPVPLVSVEPKVEPVTSYKISRSFDPNIESYRDLNMPLQFGKAYFFKELFKEVSIITGVRESMLMKIAAIESSFDPNQIASSTQAKGLFQFTPSTWEYVTSKYGKPYGITVKTDPFDPRANALMAGFHIQSNIELIESKTNIKEIKTSHVYLAHLLGRTGSLKFIKADSKTIVAKKMPKAAKHNKFFFYVKGKPVTKTQMFAIIEKHILDKTAEFNINA